MTEKTDISLNDISLNEYFINNPKFKLMGNFTIDILVKNSDNSQTYPFYLYTPEMYQNKLKTYKFDSIPTDASKNTQFNVPIYSKIYDFSNNKYSVLEPFENFIVPPMTDSSYNKLNALEKINYKLNLLKNQNDTKQLINEFMDKKAPKTYKLQFTQNDYNNYNKELPINKNDYMLNYNALGVINKLIINNKNATFLYKSNDEDKWVPHYIQNIKFVCDISNIQCNPIIPKDHPTNKDILRIAKTRQEIDIKKQNEKKISNALDEKERAEIKKNSIIKKEILDEYYSILNKFLFTTESNTKYTLPKECTEKLFTLANKSMFNGTNFFVNLSKFQKKFDIVDLSYSDMHMDLNFQNLICNYKSDIKDISFTNILDNMLERESEKNKKKYTTLNENKNISITEKENNQEFINAFNLPILKFNILKILKTTLMISRAKNSNIKYNNYKFTIVVNDKDLIPVKLPEISIFKKLTSKDGRQELKDSFNQFKLQCSTKKNETYSKSQEELFKKCEKLCNPLPGQTDCSYSNWCNICNNYIWCVYGKEIKNNCTPNIDISNNPSSSTFSPTTGIVSATSNALKTVGDKFLDSLTIKTPPPEITNSNSSDILIYGNPPISSS